MRTLHLVYFYIFELFGAFMIAYFFPPPPLSLSLLFTLVHQWHQNVSLLHPRTLCVLRPPLHLLILPLLLFGFMMRMPEKDFSKNFSQRGVHSECRAILADLTDMDLPDVIHSRG